MKKIATFLLITLPMVSMPTVSMAQSTLTPQEQLEQAQKQLEEAQKALEQAKANAARAQQEAKAREEAAAKAKAEAEAQAKAKADAEAKAKAEAIQKQIEEMKKETARLQQEAEKANAIQPSTEQPKTSEQTNTSDQTIVIEQPKKEEPKKEAKPVIIEENAAEVPTTPEKPKAEEQGIKTRLADFGDDDDNEEDKSVYLAKNAVPLVNGKVVWKAIIKAPGKSADEIYKLTEQYLTSLTSDKLQLEGSQVAIKNPAKHNLTATVHEWLVFKNNALSLDRTEIFYVLNTTCSNGQLEITMSRIHYKYDVQGKTDNYTAEKWITDKESVNKKRTRLYPISGKFRKKTIDRKNEIFKTLAEALN